MASQQNIVDFIVEQISSAGNVSSRKMFGEYAIYCDGKVVALVCDDQLFVKPTENGKKHIGDYQVAPPYPGAKPYLLIIEELWNNREWLSELARITALELPTPKKKKR